VIELRLQRRTIVQISARLGFSRSTVARTVGRHGLSRLRMLEPPPVVRRYEGQAGGLLHVDIKKLVGIRGIGHRVTGRRGGRFQRNDGLGWDYARVAIDDASRLAYWRSWVTSEPRARVDS
jgi:hypothetical protein